MTNFSQYLKYLHSLPNFLYSHFNLRYERYKNSPSAKKGIRQISYAFGLTVFIFLSVLAAESVFKVDRVNEVESSKVKPNQVDEKNKDQDNKCEYASLICRIGDSKLLGQVQNFAVIVAAWLYLFDVLDRKKQVERQAWQMIDGAVGSETSGARYEAIVDLYEEDKNSLKGLDADGADLIGINLQEANLERANFNYADLRRANLKDATLIRASFKKADLRGANLSGAKLWGANFQGAKLNEREPDFENPQEDLGKRITKLRGAKLGKAILRKAILNNADLGEAELYGTDLSGADLGGANLRQAKLGGADLRQANLHGAIFGENQDLTLKQLQVANGWQKAKYDEVLLTRDSDLNPLQDQLDQPGERVEEKDEELAKIKEFLEQICEKDEICETLQIIEALINLLDTRTSGYLHNNPLFKEFLNIWRILFVEGKLLKKTEAEARELLHNLCIAADEQGKIYQEVDEVGSQLKPDIESIQPNIEYWNIAAEWLKSNGEMLRNKGIQYYLERNSEALLSGIDSSQLETDIDNCLKHLYECLSQFNKLDYGKIKLNLSAPIQSEVFKSILEQVVPEILNANTDAFHPESLKRLNSFLEHSIKELEKKSDI